VTLGDAIDKYVEDSAKAIGRTKTQVLKSIKEFDIANKLCAQTRGWWYLLSGATQERAAFTG
jgi:hypothetical protein